MQITHPNSVLWLAERQWEILQANHIKQWQKVWTETFSRMRKKLASRNIFRHFFRANFFMFVLLISYHSVFLVQFEINLHLWVFQKAEIPLAEAARAISAFWKTHSCKLISKWTRKTVWLLINNTNMKKFARKKCRKMFLEATFFAFEKTFFRVSREKFLSLLYMILLPFLISHCLSANHNPESQWC